MIKEAVRRIQSYLPRVRGEPFEVIRARQTSREEAALKSWISAKQKFNACEEPYDSETAMNLADQIQDARDQVIWVADAKIMQRRWLVFGPHRVELPPKMHEPL